MNRRPILVDCDTGIDDALALAYLLAEPSVEVVGVTTVSGNTDAARAAANTLSLFELAGEDDVPVAIGAHDFRARAYAGGAPHVHGDDGLGGIALTAAVRAHDARAAVELIDHVASRHPDLTVLALGPLTNLAAYAEAPGVARFDHLVVMGGEAIPGAVPQALARMLPHYLDFYAGVFPDRRCALHDPLAAMVAAGAVRGVSVASGHVDVRLERGERGRTVSGSGSETQRWVRAMEGSAAEVLLGALERREWPG